ncbi:MAG TPA: hypothetical protein VFF04_01160 [Candidatus Babeliales bacterium]|nr:hypothetical protein [Candidatus Babeliales bacterium]
MVLSRWLLILLLTPITTQGMEHTDLTHDPSHLKINWSIDAILSSNGPVFGPLITIIYSLGRTFDRVWQGLTCSSSENQNQNRRSPDMEGDKKSHSGDEPELHEGDSLNAIMKNLEALDVETQRLLSQSQQLGLTEAQVEALETLSKSSNTAVTVDRLVGAGGLSLLYWVYQLDPVAVVRKARTQHRFITGLEIPAIIGMGKSVLEPFLKPIATLSISAYVAYKVKEAIVIPWRYKLKEEERKHQDAVAQLKTSFKSDLLAHEEHITKQWVAFTKLTQQDLEHAHKLRQQFEQELKKELDKERRKNDLFAAGMAKQLNALAMQQSEEARRLHSMIDEEQKALFLKLAEQDQQVDERMQATEMKAAASVSHMKSTALGMMSKTGEQIGQLQDELKQLQGTTAQMQLTVAQLGTKVEQASGAVTKFEQTDARLLIEMKGFKERQEFLAKLLQRQAQLKAQQDAIAIPKAEKRFSGASGPTKLILPPPGVQN